MKDKIFYLLISAIVFVNLAIVLIWWNKTHKGKESGEIPQERTTFFQYGDLAPSFLLFTRTGSVVNSDSLKGKTVLIECFDPQDENHWAIISYANLLAETYEHKGLRVIAIAKSQPVNQGELIENLSVPIIVDSDSLSIHNLFHLQKCCGATVLIDTEGVIRFITPYIADTNLTRQIIEGQLETSHSHLF